MNRTSLSIAGYIIRAVLPYFTASWLLLSVILFVQQASRYTDIFFSNNLPSSLIWQLTFAIVPSVVAFTCPMAILVGVIIGISRMQGDSELIAVRAAGTSNLQITAPIIFLGVLLSFFALAINLQGVPLAARVVRKVATQNAIYKLESPIEPGVFNTEIRGFTIYVKDGDFEKGVWKNIFIYTEDEKLKHVRLITSKNGRIDSKGEDSELVLEQASINTFSTERPYRSLFSEKVENFRLNIQTNRRDLIARLSKSEESPEELGLSELAEYARGKTGKERTEAEILRQRRILLSVTPLLFAVLGAALSLRFSRGGKGFGIFLALVSLIFYYLAALLGEQLARTGKTGVWAALFLPTALTGVAIVWLFLSQRLFPPNSAGFFFGRLSYRRKGRNEVKSPRVSFSNLTTGILDADIVGSILKYFFLTFGFLTAIYLIFTAFELWKFAGSVDGGVSLLARYLFFLVPFVYIQISPSALMVAMLATYVIKSRQNEVVTWTASGQSIYRLLLPCFALMIAIGFLNWQVQERILPQSNQTQDALRAQIRSGGRALTANTAGKYWVANENRIYSFELPPAEMQIDSDRRRVRNLSVYQFADNGTKLQSYTKVDEASWESGKIKFLGGAERTVWADDVPHTAPPGAPEIAENYNPFKRTVLKPAHLNAREVAEQLKTVESESEQRTLGVALQKKYATPFLPFIITLFTAPFALSLSRKGKAATVGFAVAIWLLFTGLNNAFEQFGLSGYVAPQVAVWSPLFLFTLLGAYLLSKVKT